MLGLETSVHPLKTKRYCDYTQKDVQTINYESIRLDPHRASGACQGGPADLIDRAPRDENRFRLNQRPSKGEKTWGVTLSA